jgi:hypothetical protein
MEILISVFAVLVAFSCLFFLLRTSINEKLVANRDMRAAKVAQSENPQSK